MAISTTTFESTLQTKLNDTTLAAKEMLLLGKALESTVGSIAVSDITTEGNNKVSAVNTAGTTQVTAVNNAGTTKVTAVNSAGTTKVNEINALATSTFKTVGGTSILGSGDIATLPGGGSVGQVIKKDASNNPAWAADEGGTVKQVVQTTKTNRQSICGSTYTTVLSRNITMGAGTKALVSYVLTGGADSGGTCHIRIYRDGSPIAIGDSVGLPRDTCDGFDWQGDKSGMSTMQWLDTPGTGSHTYEIRVHQAGNCIHINRTLNNSSGTHDSVTVSSLTVMEVTV